MTSGQARLFSEMLLMGAIETPGVGWGWGVGVWGKSRRDMGGGSGREVKGVDGGGRASSA